MVQSENNFRGDMLMDRKVCETTRKWLTIKW
jgi:hypothetical protein